VNETLLVTADRMWQDLLEASPILGTFVGDDRFDHLLPDLSETGRSAEVELARRGIDAVAPIRDDELDADDQVLADLIDAIGTRLLARVEHRVDRLDAANQMHGPSTVFGDIVTAQRADTPERLDRYEARLRAFPVFLAQATEVVREAIATGLVPSAVVASRTTGQLERLLATDIADSPAYAPLGDDAAGRDRVEAALRDAVYPAHEAFLEVLRHDLLPVATATIGLADLPGGEDIYRAEILGWTSLALEPGDVHRLGVERLAAIDEERMEIASALGFTSPAAAVADRTAAGENTPTSREALLAMVEDQVARSWDAAPASFGVLPPDNCVVRLVEPFREADAPFAYYHPPTEDGSRPGTYFVNAFELDDRPLHHVAGVTFHEANPGHHFQISIEQQRTDRPMLRRFGADLACGAFAEGWGLYAERLADEMGLYLDAWERLGMLENQGLRAARLVTDTGIHALGWDRERAIRTLVDSGSAQTDAEIEIDRYIAMPAQALCYMVGMEEILRGRAAAEAAGVALRDFHDRVLSQGQLPLPSFRRIFGTA
jgi:uncharacterized protein (DUF885 family)